MSENKMVELAEKSGFIVDKLSKKHQKNFIFWGGYSCQKELECFFKLVTEEVIKKPINCGTGYCSCIECVLPKKEQLQRLIDWANYEEERETDFDDGYQAARDWVRDVGLGFLKK